MTGMFYEIMPGYGYCLTVDDAHNTIRVYQEQTRNRYCATVKTPQFGLIDVRARSRKIHWEDDQKSKVTRECLLYDGVPFHILGKKVFYCEFGRNRYAKTIQDEDGNPVSKPMSTKKVGCPALIYVKEVMKYPDYMIDENSSNARNHMAEKLRNDISEGKARSQRRFYIVFPNIKEHQNHAVFYDGKLMQPDDVPCQEDDVLQEQESVSPMPSTSSQSTSKPTNAQICRDVLDKIQVLVDSNTSDTLFLEQAESLLTDAYEFFTSDPPFSKLLSR